MGLGSSAGKVKKYKLSKLELYKKKQVFPTKSKKIQSFCNKIKLKSNLFCPVEQVFQRLLAN